MTLKKIVYKKKTPNAKFNIKLENHDSTNILEHVEVVAEQNRDISFTIYKWRHFGQPVRFELVWFKFIINILKVKRLDTSAGSPKADALKTDYVNTYVRYVIR